jgi:hypothetical protein
VPCYIVRAKIFSRQNGDDPLSTFTVSRRWLCKPVRLNRPRVRQLITQGKCNRSLQSIRRFRMFSAGERTWAVGKTRPLVAQTASTRKRLVRFLLNSSSDRRVLDIASPDSKHSGAKRQSGFRATKRPQASRLHPSFLSHCNNPHTFYASIHSEALSRIATPRPPRLALQLEAPRGQFTLSITSIANQHSSVRTRRRNPAARELGMFRSFVSDVSGETS